MGIFYLVAVLLAVGLFVLGRICVAQHHRLQQLEHRLTNLEAISRYFPEFIARGETITRHITDELTIKQGALKKLVGEAEKSLKKLEFFEEKIQERKLDKERMDEILILYNQGFSSAEIATRLNIPVGETELVINLKKYLRQPQPENP